MPAIKTAAEQTRSGLFSVLATPGTVKHDYTRELIKIHASGCEVTLVGAASLARLAEQFMRGEPVSDRQLLHEISPAFVKRDDGRQTDIIVLGCTHFPLLREKMSEIAPWCVRYIDPASAVARRTEFVLSEMISRRDTGETGPQNRMIYTGRDNIADHIGDFLRGLGLDDVVRDEIIG